jgi:hypothetical protein
MNSEAFERVVDAYASSMPQPRLTNPTNDHHEAMINECRWRIAIALSEPDPYPVVFLPCLIQPGMWPELKGKAFALNLVWARSDQHTYCYGIARKYQC